MRRRFLLLSASMGAGHDAVAGELAERLRSQGHEARVQDVLALLPSGVGPALRAGYRGAVRHAPGLYAWIYAAFLASGPRGTSGPQGTGGREPGAADGVVVPRPGSAPLAALAERELMNVVDRWRADAVISTFHLSAQVTGRLRRRGVLRVPSVVTVVDFAAHRGWLHTGNDVYLCVTGEAARTAAAVTGSTAEAAGPVVAERFARLAQAGREGTAASGWWRAEFERVAPGRPVVLLSAGAWGVGSRLVRTARELAGSGFCPVVLCGRDERLRRRAAPLPGTLALGWVEDMAGLMASAHALVDNAAGQTAAQALAAGVPVVGYRPLPGHGAEGLRAMAAAGVAELARDGRELTAALGSAVRQGPVRDRLVERGRALFRTDAARRITELTVAGVRAG
ncbi:MGDG synthase family glycosyltransferase [Streptomyces marispadix]|uniref:Galactosyldiacylglycerol synthase n=1 Tax=Streptomyces marispadix TaxID=2922868 RepID=A0ABS9SSX8_9ACTN|nr:galactosyldiacylglycerol synthase [Streptomyces marispadix]MCH6159385.1 galactosyldiacylglycerol synthase [Streptomyces marispadix]